MARRNLTLTLTITLDEDAVRACDDFPTPDGDTPYTDSLNELRTTIQHHTGLILAPYDPHLGTPEIHYRGLDYNTTTTA